MAEPPPNLPDVGSVVQVIRGERPAEAMQSPLKYWGPPFKAQSSEPQL
jgi:hypothetical protein